jgi:3-oxoacyl-[acyl-carrier-protein] synthase-3
VAGIGGFGHYLPARVVSNAELAAKLGCEVEWIREASGIRERRYAAEGETVADLALAAARDCLSKAPAEIGLVILSTGSAERRFPGPAASLARGLGLEGIPAIDLPMASAGSLFGMAMAAQLSPVYGNVLVVGAEKMSAAIGDDKNTAILFGDGAGACLVTKNGGPLRIVDSVLHTDGSFTEDLRWGFEGTIVMNGRSVIMQAARKIPGAIGELLQRNGKSAEQVDVFLMHQANQNLIDKTAKTLGVPSARFYSNIARYGNTSSASMLIAASEWWGGDGSIICFTAFGAGFSWGALLAQK